MKIENSLGRPSEPAPLPRALSPGETSTMPAGGGLLVPRPPPASGITGDEARQLRLSVTKGVDIPFEIAGNGLLYSRPPAGSGVTPAEAQRLLLELASGVQIPFELRRGKLYPKPPASSGVTAQDVTSLLLPTRSGSLIPFDVNYEHG